MNRSEASPSGSLRSPLSVCLVEDWVGWVGANPYFGGGSNCPTLLMFGWKGWIGLAPIQLSNPSHIFFCLDGGIVREGWRQTSQRCYTVSWAPHVIIMLLSSSPSSSQGSPPAGRTCAPLASPCRRALHRPPSPNGDKQRLVLAS